jgi:hypothetical protein
VAGDAPAPAAMQQRSSNRRSGAAASAAGPAMSAAVASGVGELGFFFLISGELGFRWNRT